MPVELHYWNIRGNAEPIRLMMEYLGEEYEDVRMEQLAPDFFPKWLEKKSKLEMEHPTLPYIVDGDTKLSMTLAIMKYLARKHGKLLPTNEVQEMRCDQGEGVFVDLRFVFALNTYNPGFRENTRKCYEDMLDKLQVLDRAMRGREWMAGEQLTYIDFGFFEVLDHFEMCFPRCFEDGRVVALGEYKRRFEGIPAIRKYRTSGKFVAMPVYSKVAAWGAYEIRKLS